MGIGGWSDRRLIWAIVALAAMLRVPMAFFEMFHHADEVWQYLEPAYGMVTGRSVVTWEYREGMRSWLVPTMLAAPIWLGKAIAPTGHLYLPLARLVAVAGSLAIVGFGSAIALRISRLHAIVAGLVLAASFELVYFSARTLSETFAAALIFPAAWLLLPHERRTGRDLFIAGLLLGLAESIRFQMAPALLLLALPCCRLDLRAWAVLILGGLAGLGVDSVADALHGAVPLGWMVRNFQLNLVENRSAGYGVEPPLWYVANQFRTWGWAALPMLALALIGARRQPILLLTAVGNIAAHSLIPHKEYRFIFLSVALLLLLAGIGTGDCILAARTRWPRARTIVVAMAALFWLGCSVATAAGGGKAGHWSSNRRLIALMRAARRAPGACGVALHRPDDNRLFAYLYYDRPTPIFLFDGLHATIDERVMEPAFNIAVTSRLRSADLSPAFHLQACYGTSDPRDDRCLYVRPGSCAAGDPRFSINAMLAWRNE